ncbi:DNA repair protein RadA [bacterium]|nr:DNA repair protein RadA [bacterium]
MKKRIHTRYVCQNCGNESPRWMGKCPECGSWNSYTEEIIEREQARGPESPASAPLPIADIEAGESRRLRTSIAEFDRVLGGGIVPGSVVLIGGAPGIGKSTLLLQVCGTLARKGTRILYVSGEESLHQIKMRAKRIGVEDANIFLSNENNAGLIAEMIRREKPGLAVVDSIQTVYLPDMESLPGNVSQVRYSAHELASAAKREDIPLFLVGHVTKDGNLAGPRVLEHLVDCLLLFEGDQQHLYRLLRAVKNRFGSTQEVGIFEMTDRGMTEVLNPSGFLLSQHREGTSGSVVTVSLEGSRPLLVEVQALVTQTVYGMPQRTATGLDQRRMSVLLAVLEKRLGLRFGNQDVFLNAAGGLDLSEPGVDLAVVCAMVSSLKDRPVPAGTVVAGEVGLAGELRGISHMDMRITEAGRLGFRQMVIPRANLKGLKKHDIKLLDADSIADAVSHLFGDRKTGADI